jgi:predicted TIM-barrel fold metal-dependent hydrolase
MAHGSHTLDGLIDVHAHMLGSVWLHALARATGQPRDGVRFQGMLLEPWNTHDVLQAMDRSGISARILSWPGATYPLDPSDGPALSRAMNEELAAVVAGHPDRFGAFATVPQENLGAAIDETIYALDVLGCDGIAATPSANGAYLGDPHFDPWLEVLDRREAVLFVHPMPPPGFGPGASGANLHVSVLEFPFETTRMVANLVLARVHERFPRLKIIATHGGGALPVLVPRIVMAEPHVASAMGREPLTPQEVADGLGSFYYDLTASTTAVQLDAILTLVGPEHLLMGFDVPLMPDALIEPATRRLAEYEQLNGTERSLIASGNALRLVPRLLAARS